MANFSIPLKDWFTYELYEYCIDNGLIDYEDKFENWMYNQKELLKLVDDHMNRNSEY